MSRDIRDNTGQFVIAVVVFLVCTSAVGAAVISGGTLTTGATLQTESGLAVQFGFDTGLDGNPFSDSRTLVRDGGTVSATSTGDGFLRIDSWGESGSTKVSNISVTGTTANVDPDTATRIGIAGTANSIEWENISVDDTATDLTVNVPTGEAADVALYNLDSSQSYRAVDGSGTVVARAKSDNSGTATFELEQGGYSVYIEPYEDSLPTVENLDPDGDVVSGTVDLSADVDDDSLPGDTVNVTFRVDGSTVHDTSITSAGEVNYTLTMGEVPGPGSHDWSVTAKDELGNEYTASSTFGIPDNITLRNLSNPDEIVLTGEVTIYAGDRSYNRSTTDGNISMDNISANVPLVIEVNASGYRERTTVLPSLVQQQDVYLLNQSVPAVTTRFTLDDASGEFPSESILYIERPLTQNGTNKYRVVAADEFGVEGVTAVLEKGQRYQLRIQSPDGQVVVLGKYSADLEQTVPLRPDSPAVSLEDAQTLQYNATATDDSLDIYWVDPGTTDSLTVSVYARFNSSEYLRAPQTYYSVDSLSISEDLGGNGLDKGYIVLFEGQRNGESFRIPVAIGPDQVSIVPVDLDPMWLQIPGVGLILVVGGTFSRLNVGVGVVVTSLFGGVLWYVGFLPGVASSAAVALAITFGVVYAMVVQ